MRTFSRGRGIHTWQQQSLTSHGYVVTQRQQFPEHMRLRKQSVRKAREKIYAAAKQLNYAPNAIARAMVRQQTENIAFIIHEKQYPAILNPFYSPMLEAAMQEGTRRNYSLFVTTSQDIHLPNGDIYIKKHMDGVIFAGEVDIRVIEEFRKQSIPVVLVNNYLDMDGLVCISADHYGGAVQATEYLCKLGHCKIGLLSGRFSTTS